MRALKIALMSGLAIGLHACGDGGGLDQAGATKTYAAVGTAVGKVQGEVMTKVMMLPKADEGWVTGTQSSFNVSGTVAGSGGGTVTVTGTGSLSNDKYETNLKMVFKDYVDSTQGVTLNGTLDLVWSFSAGIGSMSYTVTEKGTIEVSGSVTGTAEFDISATGSGTGAPCVKGTVGGQSISQGC